MTLQPSASKSELLLQCARPFEEGVDTHDEPGIPALYGSGFHELAEMRTTKVDKLIPAAELLEKKWKIPGVADEWVGHVRAAKRVLKAWLAGGNPWGKVFDLAKAKREVSFAVNPSELTVRQIRNPTVEEHFYEDITDPKLEIPMTADLLWIDDLPLVIDYKTGRDPFDFLTVPEAVEQLQTLGLAAWLASADFQEPSGIAKRPVQEVILAVLHAPRGQVPVMYQDIVSIEQLRAYAERLAAALARAGDGTMRGGPSCRICPARHDCPLRSGMILRDAAQVLEAGETTIQAAGDPGELATAADVGKLHYFMSRFKRLAGISDRAMRDWMDDYYARIAAGETPELPVRPDGQILILKEKSYEALSKAAIIRKLGPIEGEKLIQELRDLGVIETQTRVELHAVPDR